MSCGDVQQGVGSLNETMLLVVLIVQSVCRTSLNRVPKVGSSPSTSDHQAIVFPDSQCAEPSCSLERVSVVCLLAVSLTRR